MTYVVKAINYIFYGKLKKISRFSTIGILNTLVDFMVFTLFHGLLGFNYVFSQFLGYSFGIANSFVFNRRWTFNDRETNKKTSKELIQFIVINLVSLTITLFAMKVFVNSFNLNVYVSKIVITFIAQITNYLGYKLWVFN